MILDTRVGSLVEPLSERRWDPAEIRRRWQLRTAEFLEAGLRPGDRVFVLYGNTLEFFVDLLAIWCLGGTASPVDPRLTAFEVETLARFAKPRFALAEPSIDQAIVDVLRALDVPLMSPASDSAAPSASRPPPPLPPVALDHDALILFTSGTTGEPKGVVHTHRSLRARWFGLRGALGVDRFARTLCLLPTHFGHGLICNALYPWLSGQDLYLTAPFKPALIMRLGELIDRHGITAMSSVPPVWRLALRTARPPIQRSLRSVFCGSAPLAGALWRDVQEWTGAAEVLNAYGITETGSWLAGTTITGFSPEDGLIGVPWGGAVSVVKDGDPLFAALDGREARAGELGHVWVSTPALMRGYLGRDDLTDEAVKHGWFRTGDVGLKDDRGWLYLKGRERDEINKGGMKVYPADVDAVAERCDGVLDVCTFACDDPLHGENIAIALVLESSDEPALRTVVAWCERHLAKHQMPVRWYLLADIPRTSRGKVNRRTVGEQCAARAPFPLTTGRVVS